MSRPAHVDFLLDALAVPADERDMPVQRILDTGHLVEIREHDGRFYLCGQLHELPVAPGDRVLEGLLEDPFPGEACGFLAYEPESERILYWSEIAPGSSGKPPAPDTTVFLRELTRLCKKVSLAGAL